MKNHPLFIDLCSSHIVVTPNFVGVPIPWIVIGREITRSKVNAFLIIFASHVHL